MKKIDCAEWRGVIGRWCVWENCTMYFVGSTAYCDFAQIVQTSDGYYYTCCDNAGANPIYARCESDFQSEEDCANAAIGALMEIQKKRRVA